jgi:rhodanese-related sulfurtransferase
MERYIEFALNHYILVLALAVVTFLLVQEFFDAVLKKYEAITPLLAVAKMNDGQAFVVDVREAKDFNKGHIQDAMNIPLAKLGEELPKLESYKKMPVMVVCHTGAISGSAGNQLAKAGFEQVHVITGGMQAWEEDYKLPIKRSGKGKTK